MVQNDRNWHIKYQKREGKSRFESKSHQKFYTHCHHGISCIWYMWMDVFCIFKIVYLTNICASECLFESFSSYTVYCLPFEQCLGKHT